MLQSILAPSSEAYLQALDRQGRQRLRRLHHDHVAEVLREQRLFRRVRRGLTVLLAGAALTGAGALLLMP